MSHTGMTILAFILLELSPLLVFKFDFLSLLCNRNTLRNILMMHCTNVEQDEMRDDVLHLRSQSQKIYSVSFLDKES